MNVYDDPRQFGLRIIGEADFGGGYEYDKFVVWAPERFVVWAPEGTHWQRPGILAWGRASGCSCSSAFEYSGLPDLSWGSPFKCHDELEKWLSGNLLGEEYTDEQRTAMVADLHQKIAV